MSNASRRLKALEKRVAALEAENQAPRIIEADRNINVLAEAAIREINRLTVEKGKAQLLI